MPSACLEAARAADAIVHAGDFTGLGALELLRGLGPPLHAVHGNADAPELRAMLPERLVVELGGVRVGVVHEPGPRAGRESRLLAAFPGCAAVVYGHTHEPRADRHGGVWLLNPGSPTERRRAPARSFLLLRVEAGALTPQLVELP